YPVEAYLCGHTHNQALSFHARQGDRGWVQLMASSVGYPAMEPVPLERVHRLADFGSRNTFVWGILEDSAPGFYILDLEPEELAGSWESVAGAHHEFSAKDRRTAPSLSNWVSPPKCALRAEDVHQIQLASIQVFGYSEPGSGGELFLNGVSLSAIPPNGAYAARRFVPVGNEALATISLSNTLTMRMPSTGEFAIGSFALEVRLVDGRTCRTAPAAEIFVRGDRWLEFSGNRTTVPCETDATVSLELGWLETS
ncbi:MAG: hypothetical protein KAI66_26275, partial [Lentisphaeria bacterium]|nr:hypothetical protein [Lentisphaeria bacterium]